MRKRKTSPRNNILFEQLYLSLTYENVRLSISFYSIFFSSTICFISNDSPQNCSFPFSYGTIASHNLAGDGLGFTQQISPAASA